MSHLCECGCGQPTKPASKTNAARGWIKGQPLRFLYGHQGRGRLKPGPRWREEDRGYETPCWIWQLSPNAQGYAQANIGGKVRRMHRYLYELEYGPLPTDVQLDHLCRQRNCVRLDHLEPVTNAENTRRGQVAKLTVPDVRVIRRLLAEGISQREVAGRFGVSPPQISYIKHGQTWAGV